jgi:DNA polymerase-3 subunit beta
VIQGAITLKPQAFASAVKWAAKFVTAKPTVPIHGGILLDVAAGMMTIVSYSENVSARALVPADGDGTGRAVVSGRLLAELVGTFPDKPVTLTCDDESVTVSAGRFRVTLPTMNAADYPAQPQQPAKAGTMPGQAFADVVQRVAVAASHDLSNRVALACVHLTFSESNVRALATDSYRLVRSDAPYTGEAGEALVLAQTLLDVANAFTGPDDIDVGLDPANLSLTSPTRSVTVRMIGEAYDAQNFAKFFGRQMPQSARIEVADMAAPLKRAALVRAKDGPIRVTFGNDLISLAAVAEDIKQDSDEEVEADYTGPEHTMAFNPKYFADALATAPGKTVDIAFDDTAVMPAFFTVPGDDTWEHILVPIRLAK